MIEVVLAIATIFGGITAIWFFWDKYHGAKNWIESERIVNSDWWDSSELRQKLEEQGYSFRWSNRNKVEERKQMGYEIIYQNEKTERKKYILVNKNGQILIGVKG